MIKNEDIQHGLSQDYAHKVIPTDVKRVIIPLPKGIIGQDVEYTSWDGSSATGNGFLFQNATDKRTEFITADGGIFIGHEGECPEGPNGTMIMRSEAVKMYLASHPGALQPENIAQTIKYLQTRVFKHDVSDVTKWNEKENPDIWSSDLGWLKKNFNESDIYDANDEIRSVISAAKKTEIESDVIFLGPDTDVEGIGKTGDRGSWAVRKPDGTINLCTEEVFNNTYKRSGDRGSVNLVFSEGLVDVQYPKGSMRYMPPQKSKAPKVSDESILNNYRKQCSELETPVYRVICSALCDYLEKLQGRKITVKLEINSLFAFDRNELSLTKNNPKSELLRPLLEGHIINEKGAIINPEKFANSDFVKNYRNKGIDLSQTQTIQAMSKNNTHFNSKEQSNQRD